MASAHRGKKTRPYKRGPGNVTVALNLLIGQEAERMKAADPLITDGAIAKEINDRGIPSSLPGVFIHIRTMSAESIRKSLPAARREWAAFKVDLPAPAAPRPIEFPTGGLLDGLAKLAPWD